MNRMTKCYDLIVKIKYKIRMREKSHFKWWNLQKWFNSRQIRSPLKSQRTLQIIFAKFSIHFTYIKTP